MKSRRNFGCLVLIAASFASASLVRAASFSSVTNFSFAAGDVVFDTARNELYLSQTESNCVWRINPVDGAIEGSFVFDFKPGLLALTPDGSNLVVHFPTDFNGAQAYAQAVNLATGEKAALFPISAGSISDLICPDNDLIVCVHGSIVKSFRMGSPDVLGSWSVGSNGQLAPNTSTDFYGASYYVVRHFSIDPATGQVGQIASRDSSGYKPFLHPSGTNLIASSGAIYSASSDPAEDLVYLRSLPFKVEAVAFDMIENAFFAATATNVVYCDATTYEPIRAFPVTNTPVCLALASDVLVCVTIRSSETRLFTIPNPAAGASTNSPPEPAFTFDPLSPDTLTPVVLDASRSQDTQDSVTEMLFRWDWDDDGQFDTDWLATPSASQRFRVPGDQRVVLEVMDSRGATAAVTNTLHIVSGADAGVPGRTNAPFHLPFAASDVVLGPDGTHAYLADPMGKCVVELNLLNGLITREFPCSLAPVTLSLTPDRRFLYAGLTPGWPRSYQQTYDYGLVDEFDLSTGLRTREFEITADPFDMIATADTLIVSCYRYSSGYSGGGWWLDTALQRTNFHIGYGLQMALHPSGTAFYVTPTDSIPYDITRYSFDTNGITGAYDSRYHGDHPVGKNVWVEPQGKFVLTQGGGIYTSAPVRDDDMFYLQTLENGPAEDCFFDASRNAVFTVADTQVSYYNSAGFVLSKDYTIVAGGRFVLANSDSLFAFSVTSNATIVQAIVNPAIGAETNQPPQAEFVLQTGSGLPVVVQLDASGTTDDIDPPEALLYRWDFDDNGVYDTSFTNSPVASCTFPLPGTRFVTLQVKDRYGALAVKRESIHIQAPVTEPSVAAPEPVFEAPIAATAAVFDPVRPCFYVINQTTRRLMKLNLLNGLVEAEAFFDQQPLALAINPAGTYLYVALQPKDYTTSTPASLIAEFDLASGLAYRTFEIPINVYKLAATDRRIVLVTGYSGSSFSNPLSYDSLSGAELGRAGFYYNCEVALGPAQNRVFIAERNVSPAGIAQVDFNPLTGVFGESTGVGSSGGVMYVDPTGQWVVTSYGNVYSTNAVHLRRLENGTMSGAWFDPARPALFTVGTGKVTFYNARTFELAATYPALPNSTYVGGWSNVLYAVSSETNRLVVQRMLTPAQGSETNTPPQPVFAATPSPFPSFQEIAFDAGASRDDSTPTDRLLYRWDWESDGTFDTPYTNSTTATHRFNIAGQVRVTLQVKDRFGEVSTLLKTEQVIASPDPGIVVSNLLDQTGGIEIAGSAFDPVRPYLYLIDSASNRVLRVYLSTNAVTTSPGATLPAYIDRIFQLDSTPRLITVTPSGTRMCVAEFPATSGPGFINVFDLQTLARVSQFQVPEAPYDILATDSLLIYSVRAYSGLRSFRLSDGAELSYFQGYGSGLTHLALHPSQRFFYGTYTSTTSGDVRRFDLNSASGVITQTLVASALDRYYSPGIFINPSGTNLLTRRGYFCTVSEDPSQDLATRITLNPPQLNDAVFAPQRHALFTASGSRLNLFDLRDLQLKHTFDLGQSIRRLAVYGDRLYSLCETGTNLFVVSRLLPSIDVQSNLPPSFVRIIQPTNGAIIPLPGVLQLEAESEDPDGWINRVEYNLGLAHLGTSTNAGFRLAWTNPPSGTYPITATAQDNWGATVASDPVTVTFNQRPLVEITSPASNQVFVAPSTLQFTVSASDPDGSVAAVQYYLNSTFIGSATATPFALELSNPPMGTNVLEAMAIDDLGTESLRATNRFEVLPAVPNDLFAGRLGLSGTSFSVSATTARATVEKGEPQHASNVGGHSIWYTWTASAKGVVVLDTIGSDFDTLLAVYTGQTLSTLSEVASNDDFPGLGSLSRVKFISSPGTVYQIAVDGSRGAAGHVALNMAFSPSPSGPIISNDLFANRQLLTWDSNNQIAVTATNDIATREYNEPYHAGNIGGKSLWYAWTPPTDGSVTATTAGSDFDTLLAIYTGTSLWFSTAVASNDDDPSGGFTSRVCFNVTAGVDYNLAVDGLNGASGSIQLGLTFSTNRLDLPSNDFFAAPLLLTNASFAQTAFSASATTEPDEPLHAGNAGGKSLWYSWTPPVSGLATISTKGSGFDTVLAVYTGSDLAGLVPIVANDDTDAGSTRAEVGFEAMAGTQYQIAVDGYNGVGGTVMVSASIERTAPAPFNDNFADRVTLIGTNLQIEASNVGASREKSEPLIASTEGGTSLWWTWSAPTNGVLVVSTTGSDFDTLLGVFRGATLAALTTSASSDDLVSESGSRVKFTVSAGSVYQIAVDGYRGACGNLRMQLRFLPSSTPAASPSNDMFLYRHLITGTSNTVTGTNVMASRENFEPAHAGHTASHSLWWTWTAPAAGPVTLTTAGSDFDTVIAVYTGSSVSFLTPVASNDDATSDSLTSRLSFSAVAGMSYNIAVDGFEGAAGSVRLNLVQSQLSLRPTNDDFADPLMLSGFAVVSQGQNSGATAEPGEPSLSGAPATRSVWWTWVAPTTGPVKLSTKGSTFDTLLAVYSGDQLSSLKKIVENDDDPAGGLESVVTFEAARGQVCWIQVDGYEGASGLVALTLSATPPLSIQSPVMQLGSFLLHIDGPLGNSCVIETSTNLTTWVPVATNTLPFDFAHPRPESDTARYFRAK